MKKAFTIVELLIALAVMSVAFLIASVVFKISIDTQRAARATSEVMRNFRAITDQLNTDFTSPCDDGEVFLVWVPSRIDPNVDAWDVNSEDFDGDGYLRFDRLMFFTNGDFQSYNEWPASTTSGRKIVEGFQARVSYMIANDVGDPNDPNNKPYNNPPRKRSLARTQHVLAYGDGIENFFADVNAFSDNDWRLWNNKYEYDCNMTIDQWKNLGDLNDVIKDNMLSVISGVHIVYNNVTPWGAQINPMDPNTIHMLLCEGVGEFAVQLWREDLLRWFPEVDPDGDGDPNNDTDFVDISGITLGTNRVIGRWNPGDGKLTEELDRWDPNDTNIGRALKFTFTLYDSKGVLPEGKRFTHIVYLKN